MRIEEGKSLYGNLQFYEFFQRREEPKVQNPRLRLKIWLDIGSG